MGDTLQRRDFIRTTVLAAGGLCLAGAGRAAAFTPYEPVDEKLYGGINRVQDPAAKSVLEKKHAPVIELPGQVKRGEPFAVTVTMGEIIHPMSQAHYIQYVQLLAGNEPVGRMEFSSRFSEPRATFFLALDKPVTLVARIYCNLHGLWQSEKDVKPA